MLRWRALWWAVKGDGWLDLSPDIAEGVHAYATQQCDANYQLGMSFAHLWKMEYIELLEDVYESDDDDVE